MLVAAILVASSLYVVYNMIMSSSDGPKNSATSAANENDTVVRTHEEPDTSQIDGTRVDTSAHQLHETGEWHLTEEEKAKIARIDAINNHDWNEADDMEIKDILTPSGPIPAPPPTLQETPANAPEIKDIREPSGPTPAPLKPKPEPPSKEFVKLCKRGNTWIC